MEYKPIGKSTEIQSDRPKQHCTDLFFCALFSMFLLAFFAVAGYGFGNGNPDLIVYPFDVSGNQCGRPGTATSNFSYLYFVSPINYPQYTVCVQDCENPSSTCHPNTWVLDCSPLFVFRDSNNTKEHALPYSASAFLSHFCVPEKSTALALYNAVSGTIHDGDTFEWAQDIIACWTATVIVVGVSFVCSLLYLTLLRWCTWLIVGFSILGIVILLLGFGYFITYEADSNYNSAAQTTTHSTMVYISYGCYAATGLFCLIMLCMWRRIELAVAITKTAVEFMGEVCSILIIPILSFCMTVGLVCFWIFALAFLYSCGSIEHKDQYNVFGNVSWDKYTQAGFYFEAVGFIWVIEFEILLTQIVIALAVCYWYFNHADPRKHPTMICKAIGTALRYHLGSVALAALILTLVKLVKWFLFYLQHRVYSEHFQGNQMVKFLCYCVGCLVQCFERFIQFIDKNALITMAYSSNSFCTCAVEALELLTTNGLRFLAIGSIGEFLGLLGKTLISVGSAAIGFLLVTKDTYYSDRIASPVPPTVVFLLVGYCVSSLFLSVFEMVCDCLIIYYLEDERRADTQAKMHAPEALQEFMETERRKEDSTCCFCL